MRTLSLLLLCLAPACGDPAASTATPDTAGAVDGARPAVARDPRVTAAQEALGRGRLDVARTLLAQLGPGLERHLMEARAALLAGDTVTTLRELERAREGWAGDPRVYATTVEVYAALGRHGAARDELELALSLVGSTPELERAKGVLLITLPGNVEPGLAALEKALAANPELPYLERPLSQAYLLLGRQALGSGLPEVALEAADSSLRWDPLDPDARELRADALGALAREEEALFLYEELLSEGRPVELSMAHLANQGAMRRLLVKDRPGALALWKRARALGLADDSMVTGASVLHDESVAHVDRGLDAYTAGEFDPAAAEFRLALEYEPRNLEARNALGVALFKLGDHDGAAAAWRTVLDRAEAEGVELPEPTHLNLARALVLAGRVPEARGLLEEWLERHALLAGDPEASAPWTAETRELLENLPD